MQCQDSYRNGFRAKQTIVKRSNSVRPEDFPLGSTESRAAVRGMLEQTRDAPTLEEVLEGHWGEESEELTAEDYERKADELGKTARLGDTLAQRIIGAYKRMARYLREEREVPRVPER
jgi:propanediol dehydratase small subunit